MKLKAEVKVLCRPPPNVFKRFSILSFAPNVDSRALNPSSRASVIDFQGAALAGNPALNLYFPDEVVWIVKWDWLTITDVTSACELRHFESKNFIPN